jgi:uncharacterized membrane protein YphA (DoxX/SURF4 family)
LASLAFIIIGFAKFGDPSWARSFARWGYPPGFYIVIGAAEMLGGVCLLVPRIASYAAVLLGIIMIGASATHFVHDEMARVTPPLMYLALVTVVGLARWRSAPSLKRARRSAAPVQPV